MGSPNEGTSIQHQTTLPSKTSPDPVAPHYRVEPIVRELRDIPVPRAPQRYTTMPKLPEQGPPAPVPGPANPLYPGGR